MLFRKKEKTDFYTIFSETGRLLVQGSDLLSQVILDNDDNRVSARNHLHDIEHAADENAHLIHRKLNETFVTPMDRDDITLLAGKLDDCMDFMDEAADLVVLYELDELPTPLSTQVEVIQQCANLTADAMDRLRTLADLRDYTVEINRLENVGDRAYRKLVATLFKEEPDPVQIIKLKDIITCLEEAVDSFEELANVIETISIKES